MFSLYRQNNYNHYIIFKHVGITNPAVRIISPFTHLSSRYYIDNASAYFSQWPAYLNRKPSNIFVTKKINKQSKHEPIQTIMYYQQQQHQDGKESQLPESCNYRHFRRSHKEKEQYIKDCIAKCDNLNHSFIHCNNNLDYETNNYTNSKMTQIFNKLDKSKKTLLLECKHVLFDHVLCHTGGLPPLNRIYNAENNGSSDCNDADENTITSNSTVSEKYTDVNIFDTRKHANIQAGDFVYDYEYLVDGKIWQRVAVGYCRPYLKQFLQYVTKQFNVGLICSVRNHNVLNMIEYWNREWFGKNNDNNSILFVIHPKETYNYNVETIEVKQILQQLKQYCNENGSNISSSKPYKSDDFLVIRAVPYMQDSNNCNNDSDNEIKKLYENNYQKDESTIHMIPWNTTNYNDDYLQILQHKILPLWQENGYIDESVHSQLVQFPQTNVLTTYHSDIVKQTNSKEYITKTRGMASKILDYDNKGYEKIIQQVKQHITFTSITNGEYAALC